MRGIRKKVNLVLARKPLRPVCYIGSAQKIVTGEQMSGKSKEEIAFELVAKLKGVGVWGENNMQQILDMYAECLEATSGLRSVQGRKPSALQLAEPASGASEKGSAPAPRQTIPAPRPPAHGQPAPTQTAVRQQQQQQLQQSLQQQQPIPQTR